jgi:hypothetical protein
MDAMLKLETRQVGAQKPCGEFFWPPRDGHITPSSVVAVARLRLVRYRLSGLGSVFGPERDSGFYGYLNIPQINLYLKLSTEEKLTT